MSKIKTDLFFISVILITTRFGEGIRASDNSLQLSICGNKRFNIFLIFKGYWLSKFNWIDNLGDSQLDLGGGFFQAGILFLF